MQKRRDEQKRREKMIWKEETNKTNEMKWDEIKKGDQKRQMETERVLTHNPVLQPQRATADPWAS